MNIAGLILLYFMCACVVCEVMKILFEKYNIWSFFLWPLYIIVYLVILFYFLLYKGGVRINRKINRIRRKRMRGKR